MRLFYWRWASYRRVPAPLPSLRGYGHLAHKGEKVGGDSTGFLAEPSGRIGSSGVWVMQSCDLPNVWCAGLQVGQHLLWLPPWYAVRGCWSN